MATFSSHKGFTVSSLRWGGLLLSHWTSLSVKLPWNLFFKRRDQECRTGSILDTFSPYIVTSVSWWYFKWPMELFRYLANIPCDSVIDYKSAFFGMPLVIRVGLAMYRGIEFCIVRHPEAVARNGWGHANRSDTLRFKVVVVTILYAHALVLSKTFVDCSTANCCSSVSCCQIEALATII